MGRDARRRAVAQAAEGSASAPTTGLTASAGVAPNKFLAKIASGWKKPDGLTVISPERVEPFLQKLPVDALWGVGPVTAREAARAAASSGSSTCAPPIRSCCATRSAASPTGCGSSPTASTIARSTPNREAKSSGSENTYPEDLTDLATIRDGDRRDGVARDRAGSQRRQLLARTVTIKVRYDDFTTITRSHSALPTRDEARPDRARRAPARQDRGRRAAGPAARRQRAQFPRRQRRRRGARSAAVRGVMTTHQDTRATGTQGGGHLGSGAVRQVPARAGAAVLRSARAGPTAAGHARRRSRLRHRAS